MELMTVGELIGLLRKWPGDELLWGRDLANGDAWPLEMPRVAKGDNGKYVQLRWRGESAEFTVTHWIMALEHCDPDWPVVMVNLHTLRRDSVVDVAPYDADEERNPYWYLAIEVDSEERDPVTGF